MTTTTTPRRTFAQLLKLFRAGDAAATTQLLDAYTPVLREAVRRRLPPRLRGEFESLDFVQDVWTAVCEPRRLRDFRNEGQLKGYLIEVAMNRLIDAFRHRSAQKRFAGLPDQKLEATIGPEPTPSQWAMAGERWTSIAANLPALHVAVVERLRDGFSQREISNLTGISLRTIGRIMQRVQRCCEETPK